MLFVFLPTPFHLLFNNLSPWEPSLHEFHIKIGEEGVLLYSAGIELDDLEGKTFFRIGTLALHVT